MRWTAAIVLFLLIVLSLLCALWLCTTPAWADQGPLIRQGDRVVLMGDSQAFLLAHDMAPLAGQVFVSFSSVAEPGSSVISWANGLDRQWHQVRRFRPDTVLVSLGSNDACIGPRVVRNERPFLQRFMRRMQSVGARKVVWLGPPDLGGAGKLPHAKQGLRLFAQMIKDADVIYLDARRIQVPLWDDRLHCSRPRWPGDTADGCLRWAKWVWRTCTEPRSDDD